MIGEFGNFTALGFRLAFYMLGSLLVGMSVREYARARAAVRLGDPTARLWGRVTLQPRAWFEPFGSGLVPALIAVLWSVQALVMPAAYGKPAPIDPTRFRDQRRDIVIVSCAGPVATLLLGVVAGLVIRAISLPPEGARAVLTLAYTSMSLTIFHLLPIPGLDGARMVALILPREAAEVYRHADRYLPLIVLVILFVFSSLVLGLLTSLTGALCNAATGVNCLGLLSF